MKFYDCATAPSPRRVRMFLSEKGVTVPTVQVDLRSGEQFGDAFRAINPDLTVPALVLDDGTTIGDAIAICRYFEDLHPEPSLMGRDAREKAVIEEWQRRSERDGFYAVMEAFRNATPGLKGRAWPGPFNYEQIPALAERGKLRVQNFLNLMNDHLDGRTFVALERFSVADITAFITVEFAAWAKVRMTDAHPHLQRWHRAIGERPSAKA